LKFVGIFMIYPHAEFYMHISIGSLTPSAGNLCDCRIVLQLARI